MRHLAFPRGVSRHNLIEWFRRGRARTRDVFSIPKADAYYDRPIKLRNPIVFYEGHLPAFTVNTLLKLALKEPGIDADYELLFERGIDPVFGTGRSFPEQANREPLRCFEKHRIVQEIQRL